jgi:type II secretory pathway component PulF
VNGTLLAPSPELLAEQLRRAGYFITGAREVAAGAVSSGDLLERLRRVSADDMVLFNVQLSKLIHVGIPLITSLGTLARQAEHPRLRAVLNDVTKTVEGGSAFSEALGRHPALFSTLYVSMVRAGEASGKLDEIFRRLADFTKAQAQLRQQLTTAMAYPMVLLVVGIGVCAFLLTGIVPKFMKIFLEAGVELPLPTRILHQISVIIRTWWPALAAGAAGAAVGLKLALRTSGGRAWVDRCCLAIPVLGDLVRKAATARAVRTLGTLLGSGVPALESLEIAQRTCGNAVLAGVLGEAQAKVREGGAMSETLRESRHMPPIVGEMVAAGESSGTVDAMLLEIAEHFDELIQHAIKRLTALIEPFFLIVMGGLVAFIMASVLLPLFRMVNVIH